MAAQNIRFYGAVTDLFKKIYSDITSSNYDGLKLAYNKIKKLTAAIITSEDYKSLAYILKNISDLAKELSNKNKLIEYQIIFEATGSEVKAYMEHAKTNPALYRYAVLYGADLTEIAEEANYPKAKLEKLKNITAIHYIGTYNENITHDAFDFELEYSPAQLIGLEAKLKSMYDAQDVAGFVHFVETFSYDKAQLTTEQVEEILNRLQSAGVKVENIEHYDVVRLLGIIMAIFICKYQAVNADTDSQNLISFLVQVRKELSVQIPEFEDDFFDLYFKFFTLDVDGFVTELHKLPNPQEKLREMFKANHLGSFVNMPQAVTYKFIYAAHRKINKLLNVKFNVDFEELKLSFLTKSKSFNSDLTSYVDKLIAKPDLLYQVPEFGIEFLNQADTRQRLGSHLCKYLQDEEDFFFNESESFISTKAVIKAKHLRENHNKALFAKSGFATNLSTKSFTLDLSSDVAKLYNDIIVFNNYELLLREVRAIRDKLQDDTMDKAELLRYLSIRLCNMDLSQSHLHYGHSCNSIIFNQLTYPDVMRLKRIAAESPLRVQHEIVTRLALIPYLKQPHYLNRVGVLLGKFYENSILQLKKPTLESIADMFLIAKSQPLYNRKVIDLIKTELQKVYHGRAKKLFTPMLFVVKMLDESKFFHRMLARGFDISQSLTKLEFIAKKLDFELPHALIIQINLLKGNNKQIISAIASKQENSVLDVLSEISMIKHYSEYMPTYKYIANTKLELDNIFRNKFKQNPLDNIDELISRHLIDYVIEIEVMKGNVKTVTLLINAVYEHALKLYAAGEIEAMQLMFFTEQHKNTAAEFFKHLSSNNTQMLKQFLLDYFLKYIDARDFVLGNFTSVAEFKAAMHIALDIAECVANMDCSKSIGNNREMFAKMLHMLVNSNVDLTKYNDLITTLADSRQVMDVMPKPQEDDSNKYKKLFVSMMRIGLDKMLAHKFSVAFQANFNNYNYADYGSHEDTMLLELKRALDGFVKSDAYANLDEQYKDIKPAFKESLSILFADDKTAVESVLLNQGVIAAPAYVTGHAMGIVVFKHENTTYLMHADRAYSPARKPGIKIYKVGDTATLTELIDYCRGSCNEPESRQDFAQRLVQLKLIPVYKIAKNPQIVGNCGWSSCARPLQEMLVFAHFIRLGKTMFSAANLSAKFDKVFSNYDKLESIKFYLDNTPKINRDIIAQIILYLQSRPSKTVVLASVKQLLQNKNIMRFNCHDLRSAYLAAVDNFVKYINKFAKVYGQNINLLKTDKYQAIVEDYAIKILNAILHSNNSVVTLELLQQVVTNLNFLEQVAINKTKTTLWSYNPKGKYFESCLNDFCKNHINRVSSLDV